MTVKYEKITLWTATQTLGSMNNNGISALDYIIEYLHESMISVNLASECKILDWESEDYKLVKVTEEEGKQNKE